MSYNLHSLTFFSHDKNGAVDLKNTTEVKYPSY